MLPFRSTLYSSDARITYSLIYLIEMRIHRHGFYEFPCWGAENKVYTKQSRNITIPFTPFKAGFPLETPLEFEDNDPYRKN